MADTFPGVIAFAFMATMLFLGAIIRMRLKFFQQSLIPASIIGGAIGFVLLTSGLGLGFTPDDFIAFTFHFFTLSFMSLVLTGASREQQTAGGHLKGGLWLAMIWTMSLVMQAIIGLSVFVAYNTATGEENSIYLGMIVAQGFTQGPGQAIATGSIWQEHFSIQDAAVTGLFYASMGFVVTFLLGVPLARIIIQRGLNANKEAHLAAEFLEGVYAKNNRPISGHLITHPSNLESAAFHLGLLGLGYVLTNFWLTFLQYLLADIRIGDVPADLFVSYDLFFIHGLIVCLLMRSIIDRAGWGDLIDNDTQRVITGTAVDLMVVGTLMSIKLSVLAAIWVPVTLTILAATAGTIGLCVALSRTGGHYGYERALTSFGCCCGSTGTGLLLLRILDPDFRTPVAKELAYFNIAILITTAHILIVMVPTLPSHNLAIVFVVFAVTFVVAGLATRLFRAGATSQ